MRRRNKMIEWVGGQASMVREGASRRIRRGAIGQEEQP